MSTRTWLLPVSMAVVFALVWYFLREPVAASSAGAPLAESAAVVAPVQAAEPAAAGPVVATIAGVPFETLAADTNSADAPRRAAAIKALATAPRAQAVPVLSNVLTSGSEADRPLALRSLRELALAQGDADGAVRAAFREVIYHGDNEALQAAVQEALDAVESAEAQRSN